MKSTLPAMAAARRAPQLPEVLEELARVERELVQLVVSLLRHDPQWLAVALSAECQALLLQRTRRDQLVGTLQPFLTAARDPAALSLYDVALTRWAVIQGWDNQEIVALLVQYRRMRATGGKDPGATPRRLVSPGSPAWPGYWHTKSCGWECGPRGPPCSPPSRSAWAWPWRALAAARRRPLAL